MMLQPPHNNVSVFAQTPISELVAYVQGRDTPDQVARAKEAFRELHRRFDGTIRGSLMDLVSLTSVPDKTGTVEDLDQDIFLLVWQKLPQKKNNAPFEPWIRVVAKNVALDWLRRLKSKGITKTDPLPEEELGEQEEKRSSVGPLISPLGTTEDQVCQAESEKEFQLKVKEILSGNGGSDTAYLCTVLSIIWGFSNDEIADALGTDKKRVSYYVSQGRKKLRQAFAYTQTQASIKKEGGSLQ